MNRLLRPLTAVCIVLIGACVYLSAEAWGFKPESALLPLTMIISLILLSILLIISDQSSADGAKSTITLGSGNAYLVMVGFVISVDLVGFYPTLVIGLPLIAYLFGYKNLRMLAVATAIVSLTIYGLFDFIMMKDFPLGIFG